MHHILPDLQALGYTENEGKAYLALLAHPEISGYEVSRHSGVPRAKVYEVIGGLVAKGAAMEMTVDGRKLFRALSPRTLVDKHRTEAAARLRRLEAVLPECGPCEDDHIFLTLTGSDAVAARCREQIDAARDNLFISMWDDDIETLGCSLSAAAERGVRVHAVVFGGQTSRGVRGMMLHRHASTGLGEERLQAEGRWLIVAGDMGGLVLAQMGPDRVSALCTASRRMKLLAAQWIAHDIFVSRAREHLGTPAVLRIFSPDEIRELERMWMDASRLI